jgi:hypothetical protein
MAETTIFVMIRAQLSDEIPSMDDIGVSAFQSLDAAKHSAEAALAAQQDEDEEPDDEREKIEWRDLPDGEIYAKLDSGEEIVITPTLLED